MMKETVVYIIEQHIIASLKLVKFTDAVKSGAEASNAVLVVYTPCLVLLF